MKFKTLILTAMVSLALAGCDAKDKTPTTHTDSNPPAANVKSSSSTALATTSSSVDKTPSTPVKQVSAEEAIKNIDKNTFSFSTGNPTEDYTKKLFVFFDPQCPHCAKLWENFQDPSLKDVNVVWIPVAVINEKSQDQGASLLTSNDPVSLLKEHESLMVDKKFDEANAKFDALTKGISKAKEEDVLQNTQLFMKTGATGVPLILKLSKDKTTIVGAPGELSVPLLNSLINEQNQFARKTVEKK